MRTKRRVQIALDLACVRCYLGFTRLTRAAGGGAELTIRPFQAEPDAPSAGEPLFEVWRRTRGEAFVRQVTSDTSFGVADGLELHFERALFTNTFEAHRLVARASTQGLGERMAERLFRAYFTDGLLISDRTTLARLAAETGVVAAATDAGDAAETAALRAELDRVRALGVQVDAVPYAAFEDGTVLEGAQPEAAYRAALTAPLTPAG
ncbi:DsbA family protein [Streptomyces sp. NBS 14/10]|uniref:DsbA family oxidoreductase n=1 Tax=Streptomyces sp. NBS 14/10 TaxID=1945643 RepID=UPI000B7F6364|nr:DsbA family protein [Streptomyces sp. NBS 14/10]KAK1178928.1 DsbA family protein [Streptomyces sp. NBS 14/10]NUP37537.1 dithiol-disulfide isomerase [Streptomyces sp.]